jgi:hypothetical protein
MSSFLAAELPPAPITLEWVKAQFAQWRSSRTRAGKIPSDLWDAAKQLTKQYECRQIAAELKLNSHRQQMLYAYSGKKPNGSVSSPADGFVNVSLPVAPSSPVANIHPAGSLEVLRADGTALKAQGIDAKDLYALIERFFELR